MKKKVSRNRKCYKTIRRSREIYIKRVTHISTEEKRFDNINTSWDIPFGVINGSLVIMRGLTDAEYERVKCLPHT